LNRDRGKEKGVFSKSVTTIGKGGVRGLGDAQERPGEEKEKAKIEKEGSFK